MNAKLIFVLACLGICACGSDDDSPAIPDPSLVYFLVTDVDDVHGESFILPLKDPAHIETARQLIGDHESKIVVAQISNNPNDHYSLNRDLLNDGRLWSWHITTFEGFADNTIEILDGWPSYVEDNYAAWVANTKGSGTHGRIGFWNYAVVREVSKSELYGQEP